MQSRVRHFGIFPLQQGRTLVSRKWGDTGFSLGNAYRFKTALFRE